MYLQGEAEGGGEGGWAKACFIHSLRLICYRDSKTPYPIINSFFNRRFQTLSFCTICHRPVPRCMTSYPRMKFCCCFFSTVPPAQFLLKTPNKPQHQYAYSPLLFFCISHGNYLTEFLWFVFWKIKTGHLWWSFHSFSRPVCLIRSCYC